MGTIYRTLCQCLASTPEPSLCEYDSYEEWQEAWRVWDREWTRVVSDHRPYECLDN